MKNIPALDSKVLDLVTEISKEPKVEVAMAFIKDQTEVAMQEQINSAKSKLRLSMKKRESLLLQSA